MATFKMPLSGDVVQSINPFTAFFSPVGSQFSVVNINLGQSSDPDVEREVLSDVGTYGRQIGRIGDVLIVLLAHFHPQTSLTSEETAAGLDNGRWPSPGCEAVRRPARWGR